MDQSSSKARHAAASEARVESVERAFTILQSFRQAGEMLSLAELSQRTGFYKSTILRLAASLDRIGVLSRDPSGHFGLGAELPRLAALCAFDFDLEKVVRPQLRELVKTTQETASFHVRDGKWQVCRFRENSPRSLRHHLDEGLRLPLDTDAVGRILAAYGTPNRISRRIRSKWSYFSLDMQDPNIATIAVPVVDDAARLWGALAVSGLRSRFSVSFRTQALDLVLMAAAELSRRLPVVGIYP